MELESNSKPFYKSTAKSVANIAPTVPPTPYDLDDEKRKKRNKTICLALISVVLLVVLILVILAFTAFKTKKPEITVNSVALKDFSASVDIARLGVDINFTLAVGLSVKNPNRVGFKYRNSSTVLSYRGKVVGEVPVPEGSISAGQTKPMNLNLVLMGDRFLSDSNLFSDVTAGKLPLHTFTRISGKVRILFINVHVVSSTSCDFDVIVRNGTIGNQICKYKTKL